MGTFWLLWALAVSFNLLILYLTGVLFLKGHKTRLPDYSPSNEADPLDQTKNHPASWRQGLSIPYSELYNFLHDGDLPEDTTANTPK